MSILDIGSNVNQEEWLFHSTLRVRLAFGFVIRDNLSAAIGRIAHCSIGR